MNPPFVSYIDIIDSDLYFRASRHSGAIRKGIEASWSPDPGNNLASCRYRQWAVAWALPGSTPYSPSPSSKKWRLLASRCVRSSLEECGTGYSCEQGDLVAFFAGCKCGLFPVCRANANPPAADIPEQDSEEPGELTCPDSAFYRVLQWTIILVCE